MASHMTRRAQAWRRLKHALPHRPPIPHLQAESMVADPTASNGTLTVPPAVFQPAATPTTEAVPAAKSGASGLLAESVALAAAELPSLGELEMDSVTVICDSVRSLWAFSLPARLLPEPLPGKWWLGPIASGSLPLLINGVLITLPRHAALHTAAAWGWLAIFAATQTAALISGRILWGRLMRDIPIIVEMLPGKEADHKFASWVHAWCKAPFQAIAGGAIAVLGMYVLWLSSPVVGRQLELGPVSYLSVAWTSFMGGLLLYAFLLATLLMFKISSCGPLELDLWDPASTPGLRTLSHGYIYCLSLIIVLAAGLELAATAVPGYRESPVLGAFVIGFPIFAVLCGLLVMLVPHAIIFHLIYASKMRTREMIDEEIGDVRSSMATDHGRLVTLVWLRNQVQNSPAIPIRAPLDGAFERRAPRSARSIPPYS